MVNGVAVRTVEALNRSRGFFDTAVSLLLEFASHCLLNGACSTRLFSEPGQHKAHLALLLNINY